MKLDGMHAIEAEIGSLFLLALSEEIFFSCFGIIINGAHEFI